MAKGSTPIHDQILKDLRSADEADVTHFEEDDDPLALVGDFVDEDGDGIDDRKEKS